MECTVIVTITREQAELIATNIEWVENEVRAAVLDHIEAQRRDFEQRLLFGTPHDDEPTGLYGHGTH